MAARWHPERGPAQRLSGLAGAALPSTALLAVFALGLTRVSEPGSSASSLELRIVEPFRPEGVQVAVHAYRIPVPSRPVAAAAELAEKPGSTLIERSANAAQVPSPTASEPALNLKVTSAMLASARGVGADTREHLAGLHVNDPRSKLERGVESSTAPDCMSGDALKHQPGLLPYVQLQGLLAMPAWMAASANGKCKMP